MKICPTIAQVKSTLQSFQEKRLGFVPTMGALHEGHLSLIRAAKNQCDTVAVSIFVNPTQFGPKEDLAKYPRPFERDCQLLEKEGVNVLFAPTTDEMYPQGAVTWVGIEPMSSKLCGRSRPGHFRGVATVVSKLFHIIEPQAAFFGQKDAAQAAIIRRMVRDLNFPVEIVVCPIVREPDGLAMSSRNAYLSSDERKSALVLSRTLSEVQKSFDRGERSVAKLLQAGTEEVSRNSAVRLDYFEAVNPDTLEAKSDINGPTLIAVAAFVGSTRLIDNVVLKP